MNMNLEIRFTAETNRKTVEMRGKKNQEARKKKMIIEKLPIFKTSSISRINIFVPLFVFCFGLVITEM